MDRQQKAAPDGSRSGSDQSTTGTVYCPLEGSATQRAAILHHLKTHGSISTMEARAIGVMHPGGRVLELRQRGHNIVTHRHHRHHYAIYTMRQGGDHADNE